MSLEFISDVSKNAAIGPSSCLHILREAQEVAKAILPGALGLAWCSQQTWWRKCLRRGVGSLYLLAEVLILMDQMEK